MATITNSYFTGKENEDQKTHLNCLRSQTAQHYKKLDIFDS